MIQPSGPEVGHRHAHRLAARASPADRTARARPAASTSSARARLRARRRAAGKQAKAGQVHGCPVQRRRSALRRGADAGHKPLRRGRAFPISGLKRRVPLIRGGRRAGLSPAANRETNRTGNDATGASCLKAPASVRHMKERDESSHEQDYRHRPRHDQFVRRHHGRQDAESDRKRRGRAHHPLGRRHPGRRRAPGRPAGQAPGGHQPRPTPSSPSSA